MPNIGHIILPDFPLLLAPMEDVSDPPFRAVCKKNCAGFEDYEFYYNEGNIRGSPKGGKKQDFFEF